MDTPLSSVLCTRFFAQGVDLLDSTIRFSCVKLLSFFSSVFSVVAGINCRGTFSFVMLIKKHNRHLISIASLQPSYQRMKTLD